MTRQPGSTDCCSGTWTLALARDENRQIAATSEEVKNRFPFVPRTGEFNSVPGKMLTT